MSQEPVASSPSSKDDIERARESLRVSRELSAIMAAMNLAAKQLKVFGPQHALVTRSCHDAHHLLSRALQATMEADLDVDVTARGFEYHTVPLYDAVVAVKEMALACTSRGVGRIRLRRGATEQEVLSFIVALGLESSEGQSFEVLQEQLNSLGVRNLVVEPVLEVPVAVEFLATPQTEANVLVPGAPVLGRAGRRIAEPKYLYFALVEMLKEVLDQIQFGGELRTRDLTVLISDLCQLVSDDPRAMLPYAMARRFDRYDAVHAVNTCILAITVAAPLVPGMRELEELAQSALLMDVGFPAAQIIDRGKIGEFPDVEQAHPLIAALLLDQTPQLSKVPMVIAFEHHLGNDFSGYPAQRFRWRQNYFTSLVSIAETFDALTTAAPGRQAVCPSAAMAQLERQVNSSVEAAAFRAFHETLGTFPPGSFVELESGETAIVLGRGLPLPVKIVTQPDGRLVQRPGAKRVTLPGTSGDLPKIRRALDANVLPLRVSDYFPSRGISGALPSVIGK